MLKGLAAVGFLASAIAVASCVPGMLSGGGGNDAGAPCPGGTLVPERCYRACNGSVALPNDGACPANYVHEPAHCTRITLELVENTCGADAATDGADASGGGGAGGGAGGGPVGGAGGGPAGGAGGATGWSSPGCTDLVDDAPPAVQRFHMEVRPASELGVGGAFADGVYDLSVIDYYGTGRSGTAPVITGTVRISNGGTRMEAVTWYEQGNVVTGEVWTLAPAGTQVTETGTCPIWGPNTEDYSATPDRFMLSNAMWVRRYVRRAN